MENKKYGVFDSWEIESEDIARKTCDKSFFKYRGSGIPKEVRWFFNVEFLSPGKKQDIKLVFEGKTYDAYIQRDAGELARTRIFWESDLAEIFSPYNIEIQKIFLEFHRATGNTFEIEFKKVDSSTSQGQGKMNEVFNNLKVV